MSSKTNILVTGAGGRVGKELVARLAKNGSYFIRACCRRPDRSEFLKNLGADEVVTFDYADESTHAGVLENMQVIFSSSPDPSLSGHKKFMELVKTKKDQFSHIVRLSCFGAEQNSACYDINKHISNPNGKVPGMLYGYWQGEVACIETGIPTTALRGNFFMNHIIKNEVSNIDQHGFFQSPLDDCKNSFVSTNDLGECASLIFDEGAKRHGNKFYDITGPNAMSMGEVAKELGDVMGKTVEYRKQNLEQFLKDFGPARSEFFEYLRNGFYTRVSPDFYNLTGHIGTTYKEHLVNKGQANETGMDELYQAGVWAKGKDIMKDVKH